MNIKHLIDEGPITKHQIIIITICFILNMLDGMDVLAISFAAPLIVEDLSIKPQILGLIFSAALIGMTIGALVISPLSDVIGRRHMAILSLSMIAISMIATAYAESVMQLILFRVCAGLGIGSILASLTSLVSEYTPDRKKNLAISFFHAGYPIGAILTGILAAWILPEFGWRSIFIFTGVATAVMIPIVVFFLSESLEFLVKKQPENALSKINHILTRMDHRQLESLPSLHEEAESMQGVGAVLSPEKRPSTMMLWISFFMSFYTLYFLLSWIPKIARDSGLEIEHAIYLGTVLNAGAFVGSVLLGQISATFGLKRVIFVYLILGAIFMTIFGFASVPLAVLFLITFLLMFFVQGGFIGLYSVAARLYPTEIRTTGVGWAIGAGRIGAIIGPFLAGVMIGMGWPMWLVFVLFGAPLIIAAFVTMCIPSADID